MYRELYETWKRELENVELERLSSDFYSKTADYMQRLKEEDRMLDKRTLKARLLMKEMESAKRMITELIRTRFTKIITKTADGEKAPSALLTVEEKKLHKGVVPFAEAYQNFSEGILRGYASKANSQGGGRKTTVLRLLKEVPTIVGADMKTYGPFRIEDVASLPSENARILIRQGLAQEVRA